MNAFQNVVGSFFTTKFMRSIEELLVSPMPNWVIIAGYVAGGVTRGILVGILVLLISLVFTGIPVHHPLVVLAFIVLTAVLFSLAGLCNAVYAKNFDQIAIVPTFALTPLIYLGGIFYSIKALPPFWATISQLNPILYMVNGFRYGFLDISDVDPFVSFLVVLVSCVVLLCVVWQLLDRGIGLKN
jgi:ABC-2 type transport system permease protein